MKNKIRSISRASLSKYTVLLVVCGVIALIFYIIGFCSPSRYTENFDTMYRDAQSQALELCKKDAVAIDRCSKLVVISVDSLREDGRASHYLFTFSTSKDRADDPLMYEVSMRYNGKSMQVRKLVPEDYPWDIYK